MHIQHHLDAGVLRQILLHHGPAVGIAAGVAGVVVQSLVVQGVDARRVEGVGHHPAHRAHVDAAVGAAGPVAGGEPQPGRQAVVLGGVGVHHQHLRVGAVLFNGKGQRVFDLDGKVRRRLPGVVLDAARPAGNVLFAAALRVLLFDDRSRIRRAGVLRLQSHQIILNAAGQRLHGFRHRRGSGRGLLFGGGLRLRVGCLALQVPLPPPQSRLHRREGCCHRRRQGQSGAAAQHTQRQKQGGGFQKSAPVGLLPLGQRCAAAHD